MLRCIRAAQLLQRPSRHISNAKGRPSQRNAYCSNHGSDNAAQNLARSDAIPSALKEHTSSQSKAKAVTNPPTPPADHRTLATEQELFTTSVYSPGSPLFLPNGTSIFQRLVTFLRAQYPSFGFQEVLSPTIYKKSLWEKSGHWDNYAEDMFSVTGRGLCPSIPKESAEQPAKQIGEDEEFGLKPMNCPGHCLLFASKARSFRDLPIRFADFSPLHRNEISGALSGLTRVRRFHQDDGHIFCRPSQVFEEISKTLDFIKLTYSTFNLGPYRLALSTRPKDHFIGTEEEWHRAETALRNALDASGQEWSINEGDGAFYGPKIDIILKDSDGKEHQTATVQLDFQLPKRFELEYIAPAPEQEARGETTEDPELLAKSGPVRPVMIHRAVLGSVERFMALLIEHYNGRWPFWLNPRQIAVLTVSDDPAVVAYAQNAIREMQGEVGAAGGLRPRGMHEPVFRIDLDDQPRSIKKKVSDAMRKHYSVIVVVGKKDVEENKGEIAVDFRGVPALRSSLTQALGIADAEEEKASEALKQIKLEPKRLRNILLELENSYR